MLRWHVRRAGEAAAEHACRRVCGRPDDLCAHGTRGPHTQGEHGRKEHAYGMQGARSGWSRAHARRRTGTAKLQGRGGRQPPCASSSPRRSADTGRWAPTRQPTLRAQASRCAGWAACDVTQAREESDTFDVRVPAVCAGAGAQHLAGAWRAVRCSWVWFSYSLNQSSRPQQPGSSQQPFILNQAMLFSQLVRDGGGAGGVLCGGAHGLRCTGRAAGSAQNQSGCKRASATQMQRVGRHRAPSGWWCRARGGERAGGRVSLAGRGGRDSSRRPDGQPRQCAPQAAGLHVDASSAHCARAWPLAPREPKPTARRARRGLPCAQAALGWQPWPQGRAACGTVRCVVSSGTARS